MSLTINAKTYTANSFGADRVGYIGTAKTSTVKDDVSLSYQVAKATATASGVGRTIAKLTRTGTLTGALTPTGELVCSIQVLVPVGAAAADVDALLNDMGAYLASASYKTLVKAQQINY